jgi:hypothetical protein
MSYQKTSLLVNRQLPEYIREEHPKFVSFLEAYYEFLETKQGTQQNDVLNKSKELRNVFDVDASIAEFEQSFFNTYGTLIPRDVAVDKATLIKNVLPLYLTRGNKKSFQLFFRMLFNEEVDITLPKDNILKASASKWLIENALRVKPNFNTHYVGDGTTTVFYMAVPSNKDNLIVYIDGIQITNFNVRIETRKIVFDTAPNDGSIIEVFYNDFNIDLLINRKVTGLISGSTAIIERTARRIVTDKTTVELYIEDKNLVGNFINGEKISCPIIDENGIIIDVRSTTFSTLSRINIINGGSSYNVGDVLTVIGGAANSEATIIVSDVTTSFIDSVDINYGGAGYFNGAFIDAEGLTPEELLIAIDSVDTTGANTPNTFMVISTDVIAPFANTALNVSNYGFISTNVANGENLISVLSDAFTSQTWIDLGSITNAVALFSNTQSTFIPVLNAEAPFIGGTTYQINSVGALGRFQINNRGSGYRPGDEIIFNNLPMTFGRGAAATVTTTDSNGAIALISFQPERILGLANTVNNYNELVGTSTSFDTELKVGDRIVVNNMSRYVNTISNSTHLTVNVNWEYIATEKPVGLYGKNGGRLGGSGYTQDKLPLITFLTENGANANVEITTLMGDGDDVTAVPGTTPGRILALNILSFGDGYQYIPTIDATGKGDGLAEISSELENSYFTFPGRWTTSDSIISSTERKLEGRNFFIDYSYVLSTKVEFSKYKDVLKELLHPAGFVNYAEFRIDNSINADSTLITTIEKGIAGNVDVTGGSITVTGNETKFNVSNTLGTLTIGTRIAVNNEIRTVNSIVDDLTFTVSNAFNYSASAQTLILIV